MRFFSFLFFLRCIDECVCVCVYGRFSFPFPFVVLLWFVCTRWLEFVCIEEEEPNERRRAKRSSRSGEATPKTQQETLGGGSLPLSLLVAVRVSHSVSPPFRLRFFRQTIVSIKSLVVLGAAAVAPPPPSFFFVVCLCLLPLTGSPSPPKARGGAGGKEVRSVLSS